MSHRGNPLGSVSLAEQLQAVAPSINIINKNTADTPLSPSSTMKLTPAQEITQEDPPDDFQEEGRFFQQGDESRIPSPAEQRRAIKRMRQENQVDSSGPSEDDVNGQGKKFGQNKAKPKMDFTVGATSATINLTEEQAQILFDQMVELSKATHSQIKMDTRSKFVGVVLSCVGIVAASLSIYLGIQAKARDGN